MWVVDDTKSKFEVDYEGKFNKIIQPVEGVLIKPFAPKLFVISNQGEGFELLEKTSVDHYEYLQSANAKSHIFDY